jgi:hypothetical protein
MDWVWNNDVTARRPGEITTSESSALRTTAERLTFFLRPALNSELESVVALCASGI